MPFRSFDRFPDRRFSTAVRRWPSRLCRIGLAVVLTWISSGGLALAQLPDREAELEAIRDQIMVLRSRLNRVSQEEQGLEAALEEIRATLKRSLTDLYRMGQHGYLRLFLSIRSTDDLLPGIRQMRFFVRRDSELLSSYLETHTELTFQQEQMDQHEAEVQAWLGQESSRFAELTRLQQRQTTLLARLEHERQSLTVQTAELSDKERKLANFLDFLYGRTPTALSGTPVQNFKGVLDWPIKARVERGFGPTLDPVYGTRVPHNGLDLATAAGAEVRAVFPGKVLFAAPFQGYGLTAVVHHPGRVFSLYAGLGELRVEAQDVLSLGQVIGIAADTLYFEIREENRPVDPAQWLR